MSQMELLPDVTCTGPNSFNVITITMKHMQKGMSSDDLSHEVMNDGTATQVSVTERMREGWNYQCTISELSLMPEWRMVLLIVSLLLKVAHH